MRAIYYLFLVSLLVSGCASTVELNSAKEGKMKIGNSLAEVHLKSGQEYIGKIVQIGNDSIRIDNMEAGYILKFSNRDIKFIKVTDHVLGALKGCLFGGASMLILVSIIKAQNDNSDHDGSGWTSGMKKNVPIIGAGIGGLLGLIIGGINGHHYTYVFPEDLVKVGIGTSIDSTNNSSQKILKRAP
jgi:hypothetical protein